MAFGVYNKAAVERLWGTATEIAPGFLDLNYGLVVNHVPGSRTINYEFRMAGGRIVTATGSKEAYQLIKMVLFCEWSNQEVARLERIRNSTDNAIKS